MFNVIASAAKFDLAQRGNPVGVAFLRQAQGVTSFL